MTESFLDNFERHQREQEAPPIEIGPPDPLLTILTRIAVALEKLAERDRREP